MLIHRTLRSQRALGCSKLTVSKVPMTMFITVVFIEVWRINKKGRCFQNGKPISPNRRCNIIDEIKFKGGNKDTGITLAIRDFTTIRDFKLIR